MMQLTPNMMLLSISSNTSPPLEYSDSDKFCTRVANVAQVEKEWWNHWIKQVLPTLFSYKRWKFHQKNIVDANLVMLKYPGQLKDDYCIAKVTRVASDRDGLLTVAFKKRNPRESPTIYESKPLLSEEVAIMEGQQVFRELQSLLVRKLLGIKFGVHIVKFK